MDKIDKGLIPLVSSRARTPACVVRDDYYSEVRRVTRSKWRTNPGRTSHENLDFLADLLQLRNNLDAGRTCPNNADDLVVKVDHVIPLSRMH
jgi:5-methylcytosine-specific restriction endonuclease McrA